MRYKLRTLLILLAVGPPVLAWSWFGWRYVLFYFASVVTLTLCLAVIFATGFGLAWLLDASGRLFRRALGRR